MLSDIENLDIMLGERHSEREDSVNCNLARRPESTNSNLFENNGNNLYLNPREIGSSNNAGLGQNSTSTNSNAELNRLSCELKSRMSREMDEMMNSVRGELMVPSVVRYYPKSRMPSWPDRAEGPETNTEVLRNEKARINSKRELVQNRPNDGFIDNAYDSRTL